MDKKTGLTRRAVLQGGAGIAAGAVTASALGENLATTPANPEGPFYPRHEQADRDADLTQIEGRTGRAAGTVISVTGKVTDPDGSPIEGVLVDIWQANTHGRYHHERDPNPAPRDPNFQGWAMMRTDKEGRYGFKTIKPGAYPASEKWWRPPHIHFKVSKRGYHELITQMYFAGDPLNDTDALLQSVPERERDQLLVVFDETGAVAVGRFDIVLEPVHAP